MKDLKTPKKDVKNWKLRRDSPGTNLSKNQHFADFLYKFAVLEDHKRMGSSLFVLPGKAVAPFVLDPSIFFRKRLGDGTWLCADCDFRPE